MARGDYRILRWYADMDGPWSAVAWQRYRDQGCDGLVLVPGPEWSPPDLAFIRDLPDLRYFSLERRFDPDTEAFLVDTLEELSLVTGSRRPVPEIVQPNMVRLCLTDRPGIDLATRWPGLEEFRLGGWRGSDLRMLEGAGRLRLLHVEGRNHRSSLDGVENCDLEVVEVLSTSFADLRPLSGMSSLRELKLMGSVKNGHGVLDLSALASSSLEKVWISNAAEVAGLAHIAESSTLRDVRLIKCGVMESEVRQLFPRRVRVDVR